MIKSRIKIVATVIEVEFVCQIIPDDFLKLYMGFFSIALSSCQIVTDTCKSPLSSRKQRCFKNALPLFSVPSIRSKNVQFREDLDVITALNHSVSFSKNFVEF